MLEMMPTRAVEMGRPIASTEPNAMRRMTAAASNPMASEELPAGRNSNIRPPRLQGGTVDLFADGCELAHPFGGARLDDAGSLRELDRGVRDRAVLRDLSGSVVRADRPADLVEGPDPSEHILDTPFHCRVLDTTRRVDHELAGVARLRGSAA